MLEPIEGRAAASVKLNRMVQVPAHFDGMCQWGRDHKIASSDLVFWIGDLNYRLNMPDALVRAMDIKSPLCLVIILWNAPPFNLS